MTKGFQNVKLFLDLDVYILLFIIDYNDHKITKCSNFIFGLRYPGCFLIILYFVSIKLALFINNIS